MSDSRAATPGRPELAFTPREIVSELDRFIVGQHEAKRAVAIALRNRWRRKRVPPPLRDEIAPKNLLLMGPTGCGKTELARRLAKLDRAPFVKVEATKFTEVGYVGRDVDSMIRDLVEASIKMVREEAMSDVAERARAAAVERLLDALLPRPQAKPPGFFGGVPFDATSSATSSSTSSSSTVDDRTREKFRAMLDEGKLEDREVELDVAAAAPAVQMLGMPGLPPGADGGLGDQLGGLQDALASALGGQKKRRKLTIKDARPLLEREEAAKLVDNEAIAREAVSRAEQSGIVFLDEIDKVASSGRHGADVSREGVQRDLLPIIEGSTVSTKHGPVRTDHILFICAGAFHMSKPSDLIPELQGRLPIRVELKPLSRDDFKKILKETEASLILQYKALLLTEGLDLSFTDDGIDAVAEVAAAVNASQENIGARRLATVLEKLLEEESFHASDQRGRVVVVDRAFVERACNRCSGAKTCRATSCRTARMTTTTTMSSEQALAELRAPHADKARVHLNNAGVGPLTARAERALVDVAATMRDGTLAIGPLLRRYESARATFARLLGCTADDVAFFQTCASALTQVAFGLPFNAGNKVVLLDQEYPSNAYPWHRAAERAGAHVVTVNSGPDFTIDHDALCAAIDGTTRVVAISYVQYQTGAVADLARVVDVAHKNGALVVVDAIQALGMQPFDMSALGVDAVCGGTHKWLLGPLGHGFLAVTPALRETLTPILHGAITYGTPDDPVVKGKPARSDIRRFEPGTPHLLGACAGAASVELLLEVGVDRLHAEAMAVAALIEDRARSAGLGVRARHDSPFVVVVPREDPTQVASRLRERGVAVGVRAGGLRVTPHGFNDAVDVERLFAALADG